MFADDTTLYIVVDDAYRAAEILNTEIQKIHLWSQQWLVKFNPTKTEAMTISKKIIKPHHPPIYMDNVMINEVENHKHLGVILSENYSWNEHINEIIKKVSPRLAMLRKLKFKLKRKTLETVYFSFIRPLMEYADIIWDNAPEYLKTNLENLQIEAARIVTGGIKVTSRQLLYNETGWETLQARRDKHKLIKFQQMVHGDTPEYLSNIVPCQVSDLHDHRTRQTENIQTIRCRTSYYQNSFLPDSIKMWNTLPAEIRLNATKQQFKKYINRNLRPIHYFFHYGTRKEQIWLARLRMDCSSLKDHLFRKNLVDSNVCSCGLVETTQHYLYKCNKYTCIRNTTIDLLQYDQQTLLHGSSLLSENENKYIFEKVINFIRNTKRFD